MTSQEQTVDPKVAAEFKDKTAKFEADLHAAIAEEAFFADPAALRKLDVALTKALVLDVCADVTDRTAVRLALLGYIEFTNSRPDWRAGAFARPLQVLLEGLEDLEAGHVQPLFKPARRKGGKPPVPSMARYHGFAAGIMSGLIDHAGMSKNEAAGWVAQWLTAAGRATAAATVADWRVNATNHRQHPAMAHSYTSALNHFQGAGCYPQQRISHRVAGIGRFDEQPMRYGITFRHLSHGALGGLPAAIGLAVGGQRRAVDPGHRAKVVELLAMSDTVRYAAEFGMTPSSRSRIRADQSMVRAQDPAAKYFD